MLKRVKVKNVALIDESEVTFGDHLNILTGETGAGKSILIDSIHLALGAKADKAMIRSGSEYAYVELEFSVDDRETEEKLKELEVFLQEDGTCLLQRRIMPGKSSTKINGETVTLRQMRDAAALLVDIHGQQEHQSLLSEKRHLEFLDAFCGEALRGTTEKLAKAYQEYRALCLAYEEAENADASKERDVALASFELSEIRDAALGDGEDEALEAEFKRLDNIRLIGQQVGEAAFCLDNFENGGASLLASNAAKSLQQAAQFDSAVSESAESVRQAEELLRESARSLNRYLEGLELDEERYAFVGERLNLINHLKKKYGNTIAEILEYADRQQAFVDKSEHFEQYKKEVKENMQAAERTLLALCAEASEIRKQFAADLSERLRTALEELNFAHVAFETEVLAQPEKPGSAGYDSVRFMISLNAGEALKPLTQVASGGELSRVMLALKAVMAEQEKTGCLIFDEIDAGISGRTAWKVSEKLAVLGRAHQVICITHLPQIAAMADQHFVIEKTQTAERTETYLKALDGEGELREIARLLGSDTVTDAVYQNAKELKEMAGKTKGY